MRDEFAKIDWLKTRFDLQRGSEKGVAPSFEVMLGIGDDAAVIDFGSRPAIVTVDTQVERVHFRRDLISAREVGRRAVIAAASDVWAMASTPNAAVVALTLPSDFDDEHFRELIEGIAEAARMTGARIVGGNLSNGAALSITTTVFGLPTDGVITREGAKPGDLVYVTGVLGAAALGLAILLADSPEVEHAERFVARWRTPPILGHIAKQLAKAATSAVDVSDGCLQDLQHVCVASGVGAVIHTDALPTAPGFESVCGALGLRPIELALTGGEDYELLFTAAADTEVGVPATRIGEIVEGSEVRVIDSAGAPIHFERTGFRHFS